MSLINQVLQDLEKRHASESELNSLPPIVRAVQGQPLMSLRTFAVAAMIVAVVLVAAAVFLYSPRHAPDNEVRQITSKPAAVPAPHPVPAAKPSIVAPIAELPAPAAAFSPVSKLSDELSFAAPLSARKEKPAPVATTVKPGIASVPAQVVTAALPEADKPKAPTEEASPKVDAPIETGPTIADRVTVPPAAPIAAAQGTPAAIDKQMRDVTPPERAEIAFRKGVSQIQEGRVKAAEADFREALKQDPSHTGALQALLGLLLDSGRNNEAEQILHKALEINPRQPRHAMVLARLEVERGEVTGAINTMVGALPYVQSDPGFYAFLAALLQREGRHREAADYYRTALRGSPGNGVWMMGLGISLRASNQSAEARDVFQSAIDSKQLTPELQEFVERQLRELPAWKKK